MVRTDADLIDGHRKADHGAGAMLMVVRTDADLIDGHGVGHDYLYILHVVRTDADLIDGHRS